MANITLKTRLSKGTIKMPARLTGAQDASQENLLRFFVATERLLKDAEAVRKISDAMLQAEMGEAPEPDRDSEVQS